MISRVPMEKALLTNKLPPGKYEVLIITRSLKRVQLSLSLITQHRTQLFHKKGVSMDHAAKFGISANTKQRIETLT